MALRFARYAKAFSDQDLAALLNCDIHHAQLLKRAQGHITPALVALLCKAKGIGHEEFFSELSSADAQGLRRQLDEWEQRRREELGR